MKASAGKMRQLAQSRNKRTYRKEVKAYYKSIFRNMKWRAKKGHYYMRYNRFSIYGDFSRYHAFRLFAFKNKSFHVMWNYEIDFSHMEGKNLVTETKEVRGANHCPLNDGIEEYQVTVKW